MKNCLRIECLKSLYHHIKKKGRFFLYVVLTAWVVWHIAFLYQSRMEPVKLTNKPVGYAFTSEKIQRQISYVRLRNDSYFPKHIKLKFSALDTQNQEWQFEIDQMELWDFGDDQNVKITSDFSIVIPGKVDTGVYLEASSITDDEIYFPYYVKQNVQIEIIK